MGSGVEPTFGSLLSFFSVSRSSVSLGDDVSVLLPPPASFGLASLRDSCKEEDTTNRSRGTGFPGTLIHPTPAPTVGHNEKQCPHLSPLAFLGSSRDAQLTLQFSLASLSCLGKKSHIVYVCIGWVFVAQHRLQRRPRAVIICYSASKVSALAASKPPAPLAAFKQRQGCGVLYGVAKGGIPVPDHMRLVFRSTYISGPLTW